MPESTGHADGSDARRESDGETGGGRRDVTWDLLSEQISDLIIITDMAGVIFYASPSARTMGYEPHELVGLTGADLIHPMPAGARIVGNLLFRSLQDGYRRYKLTLAREKFGGAAVGQKGQGSLRQ